MQGRDNQKRAGFTIIEVMIAVAVMSLMLVSILQVLSAVRTTRDRIHNMQETQLAGPIIMDQIQQDLLAIHTLGRSKIDHLRVVDRVQYGLDADRVDFVTSSTSREPFYIDGKVRRSQICEVGYVTRTNPDDDEFLELYRREDYGVDEEPFAGGTYTFMSNRVKALRIEVFEQDGIDEEPLMEWGNPESSEAEQMGLPASIVISLVLENNPRLLQEQGEFNSTQLMTVTYQRTIRFPEMMRAQEDQLAFLAIPTSPTAPGEPGEGEGEGDEQERQEVGGPAGGRTQVDGFGTRPPEEGDRKPGETRSDSRGNTGAGTGLGTGRGGGG